MSSMEKEMTFLEQKLRNLVLDKEFSNVLRILKDSRNRKVVREDSLRIVSVLCSALLQNEDVIEDPSNFDLCSEILQYLVENGNSKEVLIGLMEGADSFKSEKYFNLLLVPIQKVLLIIPGKRGKSLDWVLGILTAHIMAIPKPLNVDLENEELLLLDLDPNVQMLADCLTNFLKFLVPFIEEVSISTMRRKKVFYNDRILYQRNILLKYLLLLLEPLAYQDLHEQPHRQLSPLQVAAHNIVSNISEITRNFITLTKSFSYVDHQPDDAKKESEEIDDTCNISVLSFGNLYYLMFFENLHRDCCPRVYSHKFLFEEHLHFITSLLGLKDVLVIYKGLHMCEVLLNYLGEYELPGEHLSFEKLMKLSKALLNIAIYCPINRHRVFSVNLFRVFATKFNNRMRYQLLMLIMNSTPHSGVQGYTIGLYKTFLHSALSDGSCENPFVGRNLDSFLRLALSLKDGAETDLLENYDRIMSSLNFIRFVILRDKKEANVTGLWNSVYALLNSYIEPLHRAIELTRAHYELEAKQLRAVKPLSRHLNATLTLDGELMPNLPPSYKSQVVEKALVSLDMIESILTRLKELLDRT